MGTETPAGDPSWTSFDWSRERYEDLVAHVIPDYREQDEMIAAALRAVAREGVPFRILELGAGTGSLSRYLLDTFATARVTAVDVSPVMLGECRQASCRLRRPGPGGRG